MVLNPVPGGEEPTSQLSQGKPPAEPQKIAAHGLDGCGDDALEEAPASTAEDVEDPVPSPQSAIGNGAGDAFVSAPIVQRIEALSAAARRAQADKLLDAFSPMPKPPVLAPGVGVATRIAPNDVAPSDVGPGVTMGAPAEAVVDVAASELEPGAEEQGLASEPRLQPAAEKAPVHEPQKAAPGMEPLTSELDA